jgi:hypothetical protein
MDSDQRFWILFVLIVACAIVAGISVPLYIISKRDTAYVQAGYVQKLICTKPATQYSTAETQIIWTKPDADTGMKSLTLENYTGK